jgi:type IV secretion system protein VirB11
VKPVGVYLSQALAPLAPFLSRDDVTDIYINRPEEIWVETLGGTVETHDVKALDARLLDRLASQVAAFSYQGINREHPLLSAMLPGGERVQFITAPATRGPMALAIRKHQSADMSLDDYGHSGAFDTLGNGQDDAASELARLHASADYTALLRYAVQQRRNILVSGGTSTGKTTFLNALIREIDPAERLILIEDTPELVMRHANAIGLIAARSALGEAIVSMEDLLGASLRMRPDRIILGELRGHEAFTFLRAVNTGHPGSMTTVHADSPERAIEQIALLVLQAGTQLSRENVVHYVRSSIDVFVQLTRHGGRRSVAAIQVRT